MSEQNSVNFAELNMKDKLLWLVTLMVLTVPVAFADSVHYRLLHDTQDWSDPGTGVKVVTVANMMGLRDPDTGKTDWTQRYIGVVVPIESSKIKKVVVRDEKGQPIALSMDTQVLEWTMYGSNVKESLLKIYANRKAGFKFSLEVEYTN